MNKTNLIFSALSSTPDEEPSMAMASHAEVNNTTVLTSMARNELYARGLAFGDIDGLRC